MVLLLRGVCVGYWKYCCDSHFFLTLIQQDNLRSLELMRFSFFARGSVEERRRAGQQKGTQAFRRQPDALQGAIFLFLLLWHNIVCKGPLPRSTIPLSLFQADIRIFCRAFFGAKGYGFYGASSERGSRINRHASAVRSQWVINFFSA